MDDNAIRLFEEALKDGKETMHNIRIMVVGQQGVGKTTLIKRLLGEEVNISERHITEGIDVYVNCCYASLSTHKWTRQRKVSEQDYKLHRLVKVLNENYQIVDGVADPEEDANSQQRDSPNCNLMCNFHNYYQNIDVPYFNSPQQYPDQNFSSTSNQQRECPSIVVESERNTMPGSELRENNASESDNSNQLRKMLKMLQQNPEKGKQDISKYAYLTIWDFAGQYAFYTTHQMFLTRRAIYLLVSDASGMASDIVEDECYFDSEGLKKCKVHDLVEIWLNYIHSCAPPNNVNVIYANALSDQVVPPPVILVGTHIDLIPQFCNREDGLKYLEQIRSYLRGKPTIAHLVDKDFAIDNTVDDIELEELKRKIVEVASQQPYWGEQIPTRWFLLEQQLMSLRDAGMKVISHSYVERLNQQGTVQIKEPEELDLFLRYLHETGAIIYFSTEVLRDNVVLDPKWLIDVLKSLINAQPDIPNNPADYGTESKSPAHSDRITIWSDFKQKGILTLELVDCIWTKEKHPELHEHRDHMLMIMEQLNIIAKPRAFSEIGEKLENYYLTPCLLRQESPIDVISPVQDPRMVSTPEMRCIFKEKFLPPPIFHRLLAACVARWPVAKKKDTSDYLIFCGCCVFDIDLFHRLTLRCRKHIVFARITRMAIDNVRSPDAKLCSRVRRFITLNLSKITSYLGQNLQYDLSVRCPPFQMWHGDEGHDPDAPITPEHMNHARLCVALATVCGNAMREVLRIQIPSQHTDIYQAILANKTLLTRRHKRSILNPDQIQLVFPDPHGQTTGTVDQFDLSLLYTLIRNISTVSAPVTGWGWDPQDQPRDRSLGANVERIRSYRNHISGHSPDGRMSQPDLEDYWNKFEAVIHDIEAVLGGHMYSYELKKQKSQVISIYEAC
ncbi:hypothetical protein CHS0354_013971 [Potamilus streckersoni]|uniref:non-specific serine/threonine protein kinase n=1 Tax=Potamilus streckersoni TaxID=2493646 RepID=A0AAE0TKB0_9BIVA|nr:hypothetical protein CHS0354_013971 [Potamilus streckersoni]